MGLNSKLQQYVQGLDLSSVQDERKELLEQLAKLLVERKELDAFLFVCTHNSRRSQLTQAWFALFAHAYGFDSLGVHSAGTEATAFYPSAIEALQHAGADVEFNSNEKNPKVAISFSEEVPPLISFSKTLDHSSIPKKNIVAILTCGHADENCPMVRGAEARISLNYIDPKWSDFTQDEQEAYRSCSQLIATEIKFIFDSITKS